MREISSQDIGCMIREKRKRDGLTLKNAAAVCGVSYAFLSDLENGKQTVQLQKTLHVLNRLGIELNPCCRPCCDDTSIGGRAKTRGAAPSGLKPEEEGDWSLLLERYAPSYPKDSCAVVVIPGNHDVFRTHKRDTLFGREVVESRKGDSD